jgi:hypothetical protein
MQAAVGGLAVYREYRRYIRQQHRLFYPVTLGTVRSRGTSGRMLVKGAAPALLLLLALPFGFELLDGRAQEVKMPVPEYLSAESRGKLDFSSLSSAASRRRPGSTDGTEELPTLVDYVAHMAYQEGYLYGRDYGFPFPGERITLPRYDGTGMEVQRREKVVKLFTDEWYEDIISQARLDGIEGLLYEQRAPVRVSSTLIESLRVTGEVKRGHAVLTAVLSLFLFLTAGRNSQRSYAPGVRQGARERRKVA